VVVIFNSYIPPGTPPDDYEPGSPRPDPDPDPDPDPRPDPPPIIIDTPDIEGPTGGYTPPEPPVEQVIDDEATPLGNLPQTGAAGINGYSMITMGLAGLASLLGIKKKKKH
jgi:LPXTG-motif cell wall-anchored protein